MGYDMSGQARTLLMLQTHLDVAWSAYLVWSASQLSQHHITSLARDQYQAKDHHTDIGIVTL